MTDLGKAVFISYASQDAAAALRISGALRSAGIEVWFDQSELRGGDAWDASIRRQIKACALFMPIISANTRSRAEGYFRLEWKLAVDRSYLMATEKAFLVPVVVDDTSEGEAMVPDRFREVQWSRLPDGEASAGFVQRVTALLVDEVHGTAAAPVSRQARPVVSGTERSAPEPTHEQQLPTPKKGVSTRVALILAVAAVIGLGYFLSHNLSVRIAGDTPAPSKSASVPAAAPAAPSDKSIAVLPFVNMSSDKEQEYFSDGLAEELLDLLAKTPGLHVIARTSSFSFKGRSEDIPTIAAKLHVANVLEGSVRKAGNRLRVTTQLVRADTGEHIWSETYDREIKDVFKVQDEIAGAVVAALKLKLAPTQDAAAHGTASTEAHTQYLLGRQFFNRRTLGDYARAVNSYKKAIELDPNYAVAYAGLAIAENYLADSTGDAAKIKEANAAADKAVVLGPDQAEPYAARGFLRINYSWDWQGAKDDLDKAMELDPGDGTILRRYGQLQSSLGQMQEAIITTKKAIELDPLSEPAWQALDQYYLAIGDVPAAMDANRRALQINPDSPYALNDLGTLQLLEHDPGKSVQTYERMPAVSFKYIGLALAHHSLGHAEESQRNLDKTIAEHSADAAYQIAEVYAWRGEKDKAFEWLDRAYRQQDGGLPSIKFDPLLINLRTDQRFTAMLRKLKIPP